MSSKWKQVVVAIVVAAGLIAAFRTARTLIGERRPRAMSDQEVRQSLEEVLTRERQEHEQMKQDWDQPAN